MLWAAIASFSKPHEPAWRGLERLSATCHHLLFRSRGGGNARQNRITVCAWHLRGIHQGRVRAWGTAPDDVTWELGVRPGRAPLLRLHGDVYVGAR